MLLITPWCLGVLLSCVSPKEVQQLPRQRSTARLWLLRQAQEGAKTQESLAFCQRTRAAGAGSQAAAPHRPRGCGHAVLDTLQRVARVSLSRVAAGRRRMILLLWAESNSSVSVWGMDRWNFRGVKGCPAPVQALGASLGGSWSCSKQQLEVKSSLGALPHTTPRSP